MRAPGYRRRMAPIAGVVKTTSPISLNRTRRIRNLWNSWNLWNPWNYFSIVASSISITGMSSLIGYTR